MRIAWLCDFDGTISPSDIGAAFVQRFSPAGAVPELDGWLAGHGLGDRHGGLAADRVLARGALREWCEAGSVAHDAFRDFADVIEHARRPDRVAAAAREGTR